MALAAPTRSTRTTLPRQQTRTPMAQSAIWMAVTPTIFPTQRRRFRVQITFATRVQKTAIARAGPASPSVHRLAARAVTARRFARPTATAEQDTNAWTKLRPAAQSVCQKKANALAVKMPKRPSCRPHALPRRWMPMAKSLESAAVCGLVVMRA